jgi:tRNA modification GTPase
LSIHTKQQDLLHKAKESLTRAIEELSLGLGHEVVALSLRVGLRSVHQVLGKDYDDQILDRVFSEFCIGK